MYFSAGASFAGGVVIAAIGVTTVKTNSDSSRRMFAAIPLIFGAQHAAATLTPLFISSVRKMWLMGLLMAFSCLITGIFFKEYLTSVWCFFAALISVVIWLIVRNK